MKPTGCIRCGAAGNYVLHPLKLVACERCNHDWLNEESCSVEAVIRAVGPWVPMKDPTYREHCRRFDAELLKRTEAWAAKARAAA